MWLQRVISVINLQWFVNIYDMRNLAQVRGSIVWIKTMVYKVWYNKAEMMITILYRWKEKWKNATQKSHIREFTEISDHDI